jgi:hypothetical protein
LVLHNYDFLIQYAWDLRLLCQRVKEKLSRATPDAVSGNGRDDARRVDFANDEILSIGDVEIPGRVLGDAVRAVQQRIDCRSS